MCEHDTVLPVLNGMKYIHLFYQAPTKKCDQTTKPKDKKKTIQVSDNLATKGKTTYIGVSPMAIIMRYEKDRKYKIS